MNVYPAGQPTLTIHFPFLNGHPKIFSDPFFILWVSLHSAVTSELGYFQTLLYFLYLTKSTLKPAVNSHLSLIVSVQPHCEKTADRCFSTHVQTAGAVNYPRCTPTWNKQMFDDYNNFFWGGKYVNYLNSVLTQWDFDFEHGNTESKCPRLNVWWTERENWYTVSSVMYTVPYVGSSVLHTAAVLAQLNLKPPGCTLTISGPYELRYCCRNWTVTARNGPDVAPHVFGLHGTWQKYTV